MPLNKELIEKLKAGTLVLVMPKNPTDIDRDNLRHIVQDSTIRGVMTYYHFIDGKLDWADYVPDGAEVFATLSDFLLPDEQTIAISEVMDELNRLIASCNEQVEIFKRNGMESSAMTSDAMKHAYNGIIEFINSKKS